MPSTYTDLLGFEKQATGENSGTWGTRLNDNVIELIEEAIAGVEAITVSGSVTLSATTGASNQARNFGLKFTGTGGTVTAPASEKVYCIFNSCTGAVTFKSSATAGVSIPANRKVMVMWTGSAFEMHDAVADASDWATKTSATVDGTEFSAKEYAQGTQSGTGGSAKNWAQQTGAAVTGAGANDRSAKAWAQSALTGATLGGSAKDWAQTTGGTVDGTDYSSKEYAIGTFVPAGSAKEWATTTGAQVDGSEYSAKEYASGSTVPTGSAKEWATQLTTEVQTGQGFSARQYALNAAASASAASGSASAASTSAGNASTSEGNAATSETNAAASAVAAANSAAAIIGTSTTSLTLGTGSRTFTTQAGKQFFVGQRIRAASTASPTTQYMDGVVTSYSSTSLIVTMDVFAGAGTLASWNLGPTGERGATGATGATGPAGGGAIYTTKSGAYTVISTDNNYLIECTGTFTLSLTAAATLGSTFSFWVSNVGTGTITIDPNSTELIDGASTITVPPGRRLLVQCTGTAWETTPFLSGVWTQVATTTVSVPVASVAFTNIPAGATDLLITYSGASHNNGASTNANVDVSANNGSTYSSSAITATGSEAAADTTSGFILIQEYSRGDVLASATYSSSLLASPAQSNSVSRGIKVTGGINAVRFQYAAGSVDAGTFAVWVR